MTDPQHGDWTDTEQMNAVGPVADLGPPTDPVAVSEKVVREMRSAGEVLPGAVRRESLRASQRTAWRIAVFAVLAAVVVSLGIGTAAFFVARSASATVADERVQRIASEQRDAEESRKTAENIASLQDSNAQLQARGQAPVETPPPSAPDSDALVAATTARVLAALPPSPDMAAIAQMVAAAVAAQPTGPSLPQLSTALADYFRVNPPPAGPAGSTGATGAMGATGERGEPGPPPKAEEIQAAVNAYLAQNPPPKGDDGKPPASWTYRDELGNTRTCSRDADSPDNAATYTCD